jgi:hypothetical protein
MTDEFLENLDLDTDLDGDVVSDIAGADPVGYDGDAGTYQQAAEAWTGQVIGCTQCVPATDPNWGEQLYTQLVQNPAQPIVWTNSAPDSGWTGLPDVANDPSTYVTYPDPTVTDTGDDQTEFTAVIGGPTSTDSLQSSLLDMYDVAVKNNDTISQLTLQQIMNTQNHISAIWAMPDVVVYP